MGEDRVEVCVIAFLGVGQALLIAEAVVCPECISSLFIEKRHSFQPAVQQLQQGWPDLRRLYPVDLRLA